MKDLTQLKVPNKLTTCSQLNITQILKLLIPPKLTANGCLRSIPQEMLTIVESNY
ncbi:MAG: hypothetical protein F6K07_18770 [Okeania sp. SIO1H5]|nr:hypothetical protein [Okeania sp. SIO1H5]